MAILIKKNNIDVSKIDKTSFIFLMSLIHGVLDKIELNKKYPNELQRRIDPNYRVPMSKINDVINFSDVCNIMDATKNLNSEGIKINFDKEIEEVSDICIQNMNITKFMPS